MAHFLQAQNRTGRIGALQDHLSPRIYLVISLVILWRMYVLSQSV